MPSWSDYSNSILPSVLRTVFMILFFVAGLYIANRYAMLFAYPFWFVSGLLFAPMLAKWVAAPLTSLLSPGTRYDRPQPQYSIPETLRKRGKLEEAFEGFRRISEQYPQEVKAHLEMIKIAHLDLKNRTLAESVFHHGLKTLKHANDREELRRIFEAVRSMSPGNGVAHRL